MEKRIVIPRIVVRPILPPPLEIGARIRPQWLHWQVGRYREKLSFGPGGEGKARVWVPEIEGEQHNLILNQFYDSLIPQYGFIASSQYAAVGTGSTAPDPAQTGLVSEVARSNTVPSGESNAAEYVSPGVYNIRRVYEFTEAQVGERNLTEWGFAPVSTVGGNLMARELFRDGVGNPVVLTLASDQRLRLIYRYRITLSPTTAQAVTVNIGGDGPGNRTAQFILTGRMTASPNYAGISFASGQTTGDLLVCEVLARGEHISFIGRTFATPEAAPLTYLHSVSSLDSATPYALLSFGSASGRSRLASVLLSSNDWLITIRSVVLTAPATPLRTPTVNLVFDSGQQFAKDNLHKLFIGYWQITWGP
jgi:hypothetical protein